MVEVGAIVRDKSLRFWTNKSAKPRSESIWPVRMDGRRSLGGFALFTPKEPSRLRQLFRTNLHFGQRRRKRLRRTRGSDAVSSAAVVAAAVVLRHARGAADFANADVTSLTEILAVVAT